MGHPESVEFTEYDEAMLHVLADLERLRVCLSGHCEWFLNEWAASGDTGPVPFFEIHEADLPNGGHRQTVVFVLHEQITDVPTIE